MSEKILEIQQRIAQLEIDRLTITQDDAALSQFDLQRKNQFLVTRIEQYINEFQATLLELQAEIEKCKEVEQALKQYQQQQQHTLAQEQELIELKSRFIGMASHELRTPLAVIASSAGILKEFGHTFDEEKRQRHLQCIQTYLKHTTQLLDDILLLNQAETGQLAFEPSLFNLTKFCQEIVQEWQLNAPEHQFQSIIPDAIFACIDQKLLRQILTHLFSNAVKFSAKQTTVMFQLEAENQIAVFKIQDQGIGIPLEDQANLFQAFHRARNVGVISGTGVGLSVVKKCTDLHGGQVLLFSEIGKGTTCILKIPFCSFNFEQRGHTEEEIHSRGLF